MERDGQFCIANTEFPSRVLFVTSSGKVLMEEPQLKVNSLIHSLH